jgi:hypothetical protein
MNKIFLGVVTSDTSTSNSIRNKMLIKSLKKTSDKLTIIDFGEVFLANPKIIKLFKLIKLSLKTFFILICRNNHKLVISTNPKWLIFFPLLINKNFDLYMGDPFLNDVSKSDTIIYKYAWRKAKKLIMVLNVFSPFLYKDMVDEFEKNKIKFIERTPIKNLPKMHGNGLLYVGDYSNKDRNFLPFIEAMSLFDENIDLYGIGDKKTFKKINDKCNFFSRVKLSRIIKEIPKYKLLVILLNRSGNQIPGKIYDFKEAPFNVLVIYEDYLDISLLPNPRNYHYCKNDTNEIKIKINELL